MVNRKQEGDGLIEKEMSALNRALPLIEHFSVGANSKIYDLKTLNRLAGNKMITTYFSCEKLLEQKRAGDGNSKNYSEFDEMVKSLIVLRKKKGQAIPSLKGEEIEQHKKV